MKDNVAPAKIGAVDVEAFSQNIARMVEEGGKALAAYLQAARGRPDPGRPWPTRSPTWSRRFGQVADTGWPTRTARSNCSRGLGKAYLDLWGSAVKRLAGETADAGRPARSERQALRRSGMVDRTSSSISSSRPICSPRNWADHLVKDADGLDPHTRQKAEFYVRQIANALVAVEFRADQSGTAARDARLQCRKPRARHAHAGRGHRGRRRRPEDPPVRPRANSRSAATSRSRPAK